MKTRVLLLSLLTLGLAGAVAAGPLGTTFTYQGILADAGSPVSGVVDLRFTLWDAASGGAQVGTAVAIEDTAVTGGRVTIPLDFGAVFNGNELWLAVEVRDGGSTGAYTLLDPRQALTAAPFAAHALESQTAGSATTAAHATAADSATTAGHATTADSATTATHATTADSATTATHATTADSATTAGSATTASEADTLDGQHGAFYRSWSNLTGKPAGLDDGDDDTLGDLSCNSSEVASWNGSAWVCATGGGASYARTIIVGPVGDAAANGAALFAAASALGGVASETNRYLIVVEPGEYDVTGHNFMLFNWVSLEGAGRNSTKVFAESCGTPIPRVISVGNGELRDLTVENTCDTLTAHVRGIDVGGTLDGARVARVRVILSGSTDYAVGVNSDSNDAFFEDVHVFVNGADHAVGIESWGTDVYLIDSIAEANGTSVGTGFYTYSDAKTVISRGSYSGWGSSTSTGLWAYGASIDASDVHFQGDDLAVTMYGTGGEQSGNFSRCDLHGQLKVNGDGVDDMTVRVRHSRVSDSSNTVYLVPGVGASVRVAGTELDGGPVIGPVVCVAVWDEGTGFYPNTCP